MKIIVSGPAAAFDAEEEFISDLQVLKDLDGLQDAEVACAEHLDPPLGDIGIEGGTLHVAYDSRSASLRVLTVYHSPRKLQKSELQALVEFTKGQWSDGVGEGCFSNHAALTKANISLSVYPIPYDDKAVRIEQTDEGVAPPKRSPLFTIIRKGDIKELKSHLDKGEALEARGQWGHTPLLFAIANGQPEAALLLISRGANVNHPADERTTGLQLASMHGNVPVMQALIDAGASVDPRDSRGMTPLMWAANRGHVEALQLLIQRGADINALDGSGQTALTYAGPEHSDIVELLGHGATHS
jgi:hypothetical protein